MQLNDKHRFTFTKKERVIGKRRIDALFAHGYSFMAYPFRVVYLERKGLFPTPVSILINVSKKRVRSAVNRNRIKRLAREAYRLNRHHLDSLKLSENSGIDIAFIFVKDDAIDYATVEKGIQKAMRVLISLFNNGNEVC